MCDRCPLCSEEETKRRHGFTEEAFKKAVQSQATFRQAKEAATTIRKHMLDQMRFQKLEAVAAHAARRKVAALAKVKDAQEVVMAARLKEARIADELQNEARLNQVVAIKEITDNQMMIKVHETVAVKEMRFAADLEEKAKRLATAGAAEKLKQKAVQDAKDRRKEGAEAWKRRRELALEGELRGARYEADGYAEGSREKSQLDAKAARVEHQLLTLRGQDDGEAMEEHAGGGQAGRGWEGAKVRCRAGKQEVVCNDGYVWDSVARDARACWQKYRRVSRAARLKWA